MSQADARPRKRGRRREPCPRCSSTSCECCRCPNPACAHPPFQCPNNRYPKRSICTSCIHTRSRSRKITAGQLSGNGALHPLAAVTAASAAAWGPPPREDAPGTRVAAAATPQDGFWSPTLATGSSDLVADLDYLSPSLGYGRGGPDDASDDVPMNRADFGTPPLGFPGTPPGLQLGEALGAGSLALSIPKRRRTGGTDQPPSGASSVSPALVSDLAAELRDLGIMPSGADGANPLYSPNEVLAAALAAMRQSAAVRASVGAGALALHQQQAGASGAASSPPRPMAGRHDMPTLLDPLVLSCFQVGEAQYRWARDMGGEGLSASAVVEQPPSPWVPGSWLRRYAQLPTILLDATGRIVGCNSALLTVTRKRREEMAGLRLLEQWASSAVDPTRTAAAAKRVFDQPPADGPLLAALRGDRSRSEWEDPGLWHSGSEIRRGAEFGVQPRDRPVHSLVVRMMLGMVRLVPEDVAASFPPEVSPAPVSNTAREVLRMLQRANPHISRQMKQAVELHMARRAPPFPFAYLVLLLSRKEEFMQRIAAGQTMDGVTPDPEPTPPPARPDSWGQPWPPRGPGANRTAPSFGAETPPSGSADMLESVALDATHAAARATAEDLVRRHGPLFLATSAPAPLGKLLPAHEDRWRMVAFASSATQRIGKMVNRGVAPFAAPHHPAVGASTQGTEPDSISAGTCVWEAAATTGGGATAPRATASVTASP